MRYKSCLRHLSITTMLMCLVVTSAHASREFDGSTANYLLRTESLIHDEPATMCGWIKLDTAADSHIVGTSNNASHGMMRVFWFEDGTPDHAGAQIQNENPPGDTGTVGDGDVSTGVWEALCATFTSNTLRTAHDNGSSGTDNTTSVDNSGETWDYTTIGVLRRSSLANATDGLIAHPVIWDVVLTDQEIADFAAGQCPRGIQGGNILGWWPMTTDDGSTVEDHSGNNKDMTVQGTVAFNSDNPPVNCAAPIFLNHHRRRISANDYWNTTPTRDRMAA